jgi:hypothetical protein
MESLRYYENTIERYEIAVEGIDRDIDVLMRQRSMMVDEIEHARQMIDRGQYEDRS